MIRILDIIFSIFFVFLLSPIIIIITIINSTYGNPFFSQKRVGLNGKEINVFKFRSMLPNATEILKKDKILYQKYIDNNFKIPAAEDPRITKFGAFLRKSSIDEIPQFFNVLIGTMSVVGARPIVPEELKNYSPFEDIFLSAKPGITGLWQVSGRSSLSKKERIDLDLIYIKKRSVFLYIKIILLTPYVVLFKRDQAY